LKKTLALLLLMCDTDFVRRGRKMTNAITKKGLRIDACQGDSDGRAFGFVTSDTAGDYRGWFFTWPGPEPQISDAAEIEQVLDSLELDATVTSAPAIPRRWAQALLADYLYACLRRQQQIANAQ
jgi:hypothetical protein